MFLDLVLSAATSLRSTAAVLERLAPHLPLGEQVPCVNSGRLWLLRVGLFQLTREKEKADDWVWIMDHTLQLGPYKCLIVVGIRLASWDSQRPLCHDDLTLLNLTPMEHSSGERVQEQLEATVGSTGVPRAVVSDEGTDLKRGMEFFRRDHPAVRHQFDLKHKNARLLKKELEADPRWGGFVQEANRTKLRTAQTSLAFLSPPGLKTKARYMNLDTLVAWGVRTLAYLEAPGPAVDASVDRRSLGEKLGWLRSYRRDLKRWRELLDVARTAEKAVQGGIHPCLVDTLRPQLQPLATTPAARRMRAEVLGFLAEQASGLEPGDRVIGSSEVLESLIGKYKRLQSCHSKGGMTALLLSFGAMIGSKTTSTIKDALEQVRTMEVHNWCKEHLGITLQSQRRLTLRATKTG